MSTTSCYYLFNRSAQELFPKLEAGFVNQSLSTLMKVVDHLVAHHPEALFIFDPTAFNNQCHLYALFVAQAVQMPASIDSRFLYLSFFLSYAFLTDPKLMEKLVCKTLQVMDEKAPSREFRLFIKDPDHIRTHAARTALNELFKTHMQTRLEDPELSKIAHSNLQLPPSSGKGDLYTLPKFAGIAHFLDTIQKQDITLLFKVKVVTKEGNGDFSFCKKKIQSLNPKEPVVIFEMMIPGKSLNYIECRDLAKRCPHHSRRNVSSKDRHPPTESCLFCSSSKIDISSYQEKFEPILAKPSEMLQALAADFVCQKQPSFFYFFSDPIEYPRLTKRFTESLPLIKSSFLSMNEPLNLSVSHVYTDSAKQAAENRLVIDASYETHLTQRGLL